MLPTAADSGGWAAGNTIRETARWTVRVLLCVVAGVLLSPLSGSVLTAKYIVSTSPLVVFSSLLATRSWEWALAAGLAVTGIALVRRRWFCRWACPTGLCADVASHLGTRCGRHRPRLPAVGFGLALLTLGGAVVGYPLFLWLDPLALLSNSFTAPHAASRTVALLCVVAVPLLVLICFLWPGIWCMRLCPLGAMQDLLAQLARGARRSVSGADRDALRSTLRVGRRAALVGGAGLAAGWLVIRRSEPSDSALRPPGALPHGRFTGVCLRCGACVRACPAHIIVPDLGRHGVASFLSPTLAFHEDYCREDCVRCSEVCPSGAIGAVTPEAKAQTRIGLAQVTMDLCLLADDRECGVCRNHCPFAAIRIVFSPETYTLTVVVATQRCPGCGACEVVCPTAPVKAIRVVPN
jgi:ferredoxin-type protein NapF